MPANQDTLYSNTPMSSRGSIGSKAGAGQDGNCWSSSGAGSYANSNPSWPHAGASTAAYPAHHYTSYSLQMQQEIAQQQLAQQQQQQAYGSDAYGSCNTGRGNGVAVAAGCASSTTSRSFSPAGTGLPSDSYLGRIDSWSKAEGQIHPARSGVSANTSYGQPVDSWSASGGQFAGPQMGAAAGSPAGSLSFSTVGPGSLAGIPKPAGSPQFSASKGAFAGKVIVQPPGGRTTLNLFG